MLFSVEKKDVLAELWQGFSETMLHLVANRERQSSGANGASSHQ